MAIIATMESAVNNMPSNKQHQLVAALLDADILDVVSEIKENTDVVDIANVAIVDLINVSDALKSQVSETGGVSDEAIKAYTIATESALFRLGMRPSNIRTQIATLETARYGKHGPAQHRIAALEEDETSSEGVFAKIWKGIKEFFAKIWNGIMSLFGKTKDAVEAGEKQVEKLEEDIDKLIKDVDASSGKNASEKKIGKGLAQKFEIDGKADLSTLVTLADSAMSYCSIMTGFQKLANEAIDAIERGVKGTTTKAEAKKLVTDAVQTYRQSLNKVIDESGLKKETAKVESALSFNYGPLINRKMLSVYSAKTDDNEVSTRKLKFSFTSKDAKAPDEFDTFTSDELKKLVEKIKQILSSLKASIDSVSKSDDFNKKIDSIADLVEKHVAALSKTDEKDDMVKFSKEAAAAITEFTQHYGTLVGSGTGVVNETVSTCFKVANACLAVYSGKSEDKPKE